MFKQATQIAAMFSIVIWMAGCGGGSSAGSTASNVAPVANAGSLQNVNVGALVALNGSASSDANNDPLTYSLVLTSVPAFSTATLTGASSVAPTFTADVAGTYVASLTVSDGKVNSTSATVNINAAVGNVAPVANAGSLQNVNVGALVALNGSASSDANNDPLTYSWVLTSAPAFSTATLTGASSVAPTFTADVAGTYVASLTVSDGKMNSSSATVNINAFTATMALNSLSLTNNPADTTTYILPMAVLVADSNGNGVPNTVVTLSAWPVKYYKGQRDVSCNAVTYGPFFNEDTNANLVLDAGEDIDGPGGFTLGGTSATLGTPDGTLWPSPSVSGSVPSNVVTDNYGAATFNWVYSKQYSNWVSAKVIVSAQVHGINYSTNLILTFQSLIYTTPCLPDSPFN